VVNRFADSGMDRPSSPLLGGATLAVVWQLCAI
jgi:hypothetical protein